MTNELLKEKISSIDPGAVFDETGEWLSAEIQTDLWKPLAQELRIGVEMDFLFCLTCVDWKTHLTMVYHLRSTSKGFSMVIKSKLDRNDPKIESVSSIWRTAEFHEREVFELFGVVFTNHPDLRRLILTDDFEGFPLRKDFEDPVNMIKL